MLRFIHTLGAASPRESALRKAYASTQEMKDKGSEAKATENQRRHREDKCDLENNRGHMPSHKQ